MIRRIRRIRRLGRKRNFYDEKAEKAVKAEKTVKHELLYIMSPQCGWCKKADPVVEELRNEGYDITTVDIDETVSSEVRAIAFNIFNALGTMLIKTGSASARSEKSCLYATALMPVVLLTVNGSSYSVDSKLGSLPSKV